MKSFVASLAVILSLPGLPNVADAGDFQTLSMKHEEYAQYLFKEKWRENLPKISEGWKKHVGGLDISKADNPQEFDGFFSFVTNADPDFAPAFEKAKWLLDKTAGHLTAMALEANDADLQRFQHDLRMAHAATRELQENILQLQTRILEAVSIYGAPLRKIAHPLPRGSLFGRLQTKFADSVTGMIRQMGEEPFTTLEQPAARTPDEGELGMLNGVLRDLFSCSTFDYIGKDGQKDFVSFVNFGGDSPRAWGGGSYGGDGATATPYVQFLWY